VLALAVTEWSNTGPDEWQIAPYQLHGVLVLEDPAALAPTSGYTAAALALAAGTLIAGGGDVAFCTGATQDKRDSQRAN